MVEAYSVLDKRFQTVVELILTKISFIRHGTPPNLENVNEVMKKASRKVRGFHRFLWDILALPNKGKYWDLFLEQALTAERLSMTETNKCCLRGVEVTCWNYIEDSAMETVGLPPTHCGEIFKLSPRRYLQTARDLKDFLSDFSKRKHVFFRSCKMCVIN